MYFVRTFKSGGENHDPRQKINAEFKCSVCGFIHWVNNINLNTFKKEQIQCPQCGCFGKEDKILNLKTKREDKIKEKERIEKQIEELCKEIEQIECI